MFEEKNALPRAELRVAVGDRNHFARAGQNGANMRSAIVAAFSGMLKIGRVLGHETLEEFLEITPGARVGVFHQNQAATGVPDEYGHDASRHAASADGGGYPISDLVGAFAVGWDNNAGGFDAHARGVMVAARIRPGNDRLCLTNLGKTKPGAGLDGSRLQF